MKQETLEEAAVKYSNNFTEDEGKFAIEDFINGAKWQQERSYSEEEVKLITFEMCDWVLDNIDNQNIQSGKKFDEVIAKFKKK